MLVLIAHESITGGTLPHPTELVRITTDTAIVGRLDMSKVLQQFAGKLGLTHYEIIDGLEAERSGYQLPLHLPMPERKTIPR